MSAPKISPEQTAATVKAEFFPDPSYRGVMVDVGAARPHVLSNSAVYRDAGWRIISIEPNPVFCQEHRIAGYEILQYACADEDRDDLEFTAVNLLGAQNQGVSITYESFSSLEMTEAQEAYLADRERVLAVRFPRLKLIVPVRRLDTILQENAPDLSGIDVLSVIAGEWELRTLRGLSLERYKPKIVQVYNSGQSASCQGHLSDRGYWFWTSMGSRDVYVRFDWRTP